MREVVKKKETKDGTRNLKQSERKTLTVEGERRG